MGAARARGTYEQRKANPKTPPEVYAGRAKSTARSATAAGSGALGIFAGLLAWTGGIARAKRPIRIGDVVRYKPTEEQRLDAVTALGADLVEDEAGKVPVVVISVDRRVRVELIGTPPLNELRPRWNVKAKDLT